MKKKFSLLIFSALAVFALLVVMPSCEGPQGPEGPAGPAGVDGTDGTDGVDANSFCVECHTMANKDRVNMQFATSSHGPMNGSVNRGSRSGCAKCHSYQGYMETILTGADTTATAIGTPLVFQCDQCHDFHGTLDEDEFPDYALRHNKPVSLMYNGHISSVDLPGSGNLCGYCHQPRPRDGFPVIVGSADSINITSGHWGTHYGVQAVIMAGAEGFEIPGSMAYETSQHSTLTDCADCHMNRDGGDDVGGHTFRMNNTAGEENIAACTGCHSGLTTFDHNGIQSEIHVLVDELHHLLMDFKMLDDTGHIITSTSEDGIMRKFASNEAGVCFNYFLAHYEGSYGIHNYKYIKALLVNSIEEVETW